MGKDANKMGGMRADVAFRRALLAFKERKGLFSINITSMAIAVTYFLIIAFYGVCIYQCYSKVSGPDAKKIVAQAGEAPMFTRDVIRDLGTWEEVYMVFPKRETAVYISLSPKTVLDVHAESTIHGDPATEGDRMAWGRGVSSRDAWEAVVPEILFKKMGGEIKGNALVPPKAGIELTRSIDGREQSLCLAVRICGLLKENIGNKILLPLKLITDIDEWHSHNIREVPKPGESARSARELECTACRAIVQADKKALEREAQELKINLERLDTFSAVKCGQDAWMRVQGNASRPAGRVPSLLSRKLPVKVKAYELERCTVEVVLENERVLKASLMAVPQDDPRLGGMAKRLKRPDGVLLSESFVRNMGLGPKNIAGEYFKVRGSQEISYVEGLIPGGFGCDMVCSPETLKHLQEPGWFSTGEQTIRTESITDVVFSNLPWYEKARQLLEERGYRVEDLCGMERQALSFCRITDREGGNLDSRAVSIIKSSPSFLEVLPWLSAPAHIRNSEVEVFGSYPNDALRFQDRLLAGNWMLSCQGEAKPVVVPQSLLGKAEPREAVGTAVVLQFEGPDFGFTENLRIPCTVSGVTCGPGKRVYFPADTLEKIMLWQAGKLIFNEAENSFEDPYEKSLERGYLFCNMHLQREEQVAPVVERLELRGYRTVSSLSSQKGLQKLKSALYLIISLLVVGILLSSAVTVFSTSWMNIRARRREISRMRAFGASRGSILFLFILQGLMLGLASFVLGFAATLVLEGRIRALLISNFSIPAESFTLNLFSPQLWWVYAVILGVSVVFSVGGVMLPVLGACRRGIAETLRNDQ